MGAGPSGFRLSSSLSSSQSSSSGSRAYDPSAIHQMAPRMPHLADFDQATAWPGSPSQLYSSNGGNAPRSSMYAPYPAYGQSPNWDPAFARNWDGTGNALNRTWSAGYSSAPENYMAAYDQRSQAMPYPSVSYAVSNQLTRSTEQLPISEAEYGRFNRVPMYMPSRTDLPLPSPGLSSSGMGRDPSATGHNWPLPPTPSLPPPMLRQEQDGQGTNRAPPGSSTDTGAGASSTRYPPATNFTPPPMLPQDGERALDDPMTLRSSNASGDHETQV